jgi:RNA polymerase sigma-70 factor (ECF subfamily)
MATEATEERLLIEAAQSDPARFADLYERHFERVYAFVVRRVRDRSAAEDITSEVFQQALANIGRFEWRGAPFGAWLLRIAANAIADHWRQVAREHGTTASEEPVQAPDQGDEDTALLFRHVRRLPPEQRQVILGRFVKEQSIREVARELHKTEGAVKQLQIRALETLRERMGESDA